MLKINLKNLNLSGFSLKDIDFQVKKGQILLLAGLNGAGKTTLLKTLAGVYPVARESDLSNRLIGLAGGIYSAPRATGLL